MTKKIGVYRRWSEPVPVDRTGNPIPKSQWARKRRHKWTTRWFGSDGKRYQETFDTKAEAEAFAATKAEEIANAPATRNKPKKITLGEFKAEYLKMRTNKRGARLSIATVREAENAMDRAADFFGDGTALENVTKADAVRFAAWLRDEAKTKPRTKKEDGGKDKGKPLSAATVNKTTTATKAVFGVAVALGYLRLNPFAEVKRLKTAEPDKRYVKPEEFAKLTKAAKAKFPDEADWWAGLIAVCYCGGLRLNEALNLTWADVDFEHDLVRVSPKKAGKRLLAWQPKDRERRIVPIPTLAVNLLAKLHSDANPRTPYVFIDVERLDRLIGSRDAGKLPEGYEPINNFNRRWRKVVEKAGIEHATNHDLRRSCLTNLARRLPMQVVADIAGHADIATTKQFYLSVSGDDMDAARQATSDLLEPIDVDGPLETDADSDKVTQN